MLEQDPQASVESLPTGLVLRMELHSGYRTAAPFDQGRTMQAECFSSPQYPRPVLPPPPPLIRLSGSASYLAFRSGCAVR